MNKYIASTLAAVLVVTLTGCAQPRKPLYGWGTYQQQVYTHFKSDNEGYEQQIASLEESLEKMRSKGEAVPPGYHAHLGMLYAAVGKEGQLVQELETEKTLFPESTPYMDFLMRNYKKGVSK
ncbi:DUF4810 domain-containing protein [Herbaspirillum robiniae]|uniref:DUF4810 domain-containing protein n=1 Tax=Herbaspirillum robiniae TaxID=2014887 RepID=A0ABX2M3H9_9BURK|nr:DUF4810 domain-containing protein [Herbaspirillum robiniae]NUU02276.1 DUF4810 domain-containing protein [Herbaspirillum robiniae]